MNPPRMHPPRPPRRLAPPWRLALASCLTSALAAALWLAPPPARAQTSTLVYGSDTAYVAALNPPLRIGGEAHYNVPVLVLGATNSDTLYGSAYDPAEVDVSKGFVAGVGVDINDAYDCKFVVQKPGTPDVANGDGVSNLSVDFISSQQVPARSHQCHLAAVEVDAHDAAGATTVLAFVSGLDINPVHDGNNVLQVRYLPRFSTLDVYIGRRLIARVANVDLAKLGLAPDGLATLGVTSYNPPTRYNGSSIAEDFNPAWLNHFSVGNQLSFGIGFGPNFYEDRFPFLTTGQSVWGPGSDSLRYQKFLGTKSDGQLKSGNVGASYSPYGVPVFSLTASAFATYDIGIGVDATATGGTADISYPLFLDMLFPKQYSVASGAPFALPMSFYPDLAATIATSSPSANVKASVKCVTNFGVNLDTSVFGQSIASGNLFTANVNVPETTFFDAQKVLTSGLIPNVNGGVNYAGYLQGNEGATGTRNPTHDGTPGEGSSEGAKKSVLSKFVSVGITIPDLSTSGTVTGFGAAGSHLTSNAASPFVTLRSDFTSALMSFLPGLDVLAALPFFNNDYSLSLGGQTVELGIHVADVYGDINLGTAVAYDFTPAPQVYLTLDPADPNHPDGLGPFALDPATDKVLDPPFLTMPADGSPLTITPRVVLSASTLQTKGSFTLGGGLSINPLSLSFGYNSYQFSTDTLLGFPLTVSGSIPVYTLTKNFAFGGDTGGAAQAVPFQDSLQGKPFTLFPTASPNPLIDSATPSASAVGGADVSLALATEQASFQGDVVWDYHGLPTDPQTTLPDRHWTSQLGETATVPAALLTAQGMHTLSLLNHNTDAQLFPSNRVTFTVSAPVPVLSALGTSTVVAGGSGFVLPVTGTSFSPPVAAAGGQTGYPGSAVNWNGKPLATTFNSAGSLSAAVPSGLTLTAGTARITVVTTGPGGGTSNALTLATVNSAPVLSSLSQTQIAPGLSSLDLTLNGTGFLHGTTVLLGAGTSSTTRAVSYVSPSALTLSLNAADLGTPGVYTVQARNPAPGGGSSVALTFTVGAAPAGGGGVFVVPTVTRVSIGYRIELTVSNTSRTAAATSALISSVTVGGDNAGRNATYPTLPNPLEPILIGTVPADRSVTPTQTYTFPVSIGAPGQAVMLTIKGSVGDKAFTTRLRVVLPSATSS